jgi:hypothetical protein
MKTLVKTALAKSSLICARSPEMAKQSTILNGLLGSGAEVRKAQEEVKTSQRSQESKNEGAR